MAPKEQAVSAHNSTSPIYEAALGRTQHQQEQVDDDKHGRSELKNQQQHTVSTDGCGVESDNDDSGTPPTEHRGEWKKYSSYMLSVDPDQDDKATELVLFSFARPHMRSFHLAWFCFFTAFFVWFAIAPLLPEIRDDLNISDREIWTSSIFGVGGTMFVRSLLGPLCDKYGARTLFAIVLCIASVPTACVGLIQDAASLSILRLFIGIAGGSYVMCQYWISCNFTNEIVGTANAFGAGWGNVGGSVAQVTVGSILFPLFTWICGGDSELSWRTVCIVPSIMALTIGLVVARISDDSPKGNYRDRRKYGGMPEASASTCFFKAARNVNTWILHIHYACSFGVELTMYNAVALYYKDEFGLSTASAAAVASVFGWMNLFARGCGGMVSDYANANWGGLGGRLVVNIWFLALEGVMILMFATSQGLTGTIVIMVIFSLCGQASQGSCYGIVPYVDPSCTGAVSGIVGAGANTGAVLFGIAFRELTYQQAFLFMGFTVAAASLLTAFIQIDHHSTLLSSGLEQTGHYDDEGGKKNDDGSEQKDFSGFFYLTASAEGRMKRLRREARRQQKEDSYVVAMTTTTTNQTHDSSRHHKTLVKQIPV